MPTLPSSLSWYGGYVKFISYRLSSAYLAKHLYGIIIFIVYSNKDNVTS
jgi:hypothetical protein